MLCRGVLEGGATGLLNKGGREQQASWFSKQQAVEFPQVLTSLLFFFKQLAAYFPSDPEAGLQQKPGAHTKIIVELIMPVSNKDRSPIYS